MNGPAMPLLRKFTACVLVLFSIEALAVDMNGCLFSFGPVLSQAIFGGTFLTGIVIALILLTVDGFWRVLHLGCLAVYVGMVIPMFVGYPVDEYVPDAAKAK